ncbi:YciI family protein [Catellatospora tritici]|uniref:YciI family protein n=1 Tax=Catellatospora tritici TaxID=2851566 RepID=UPI001C2DAA53|nr:YciI family protein [Catellatospora tritici]MBV1849535.1 hypothetical protein [Catellatospora tritici]MBV1854107.1 hypothetical protein [Catellatospora tritici]
MTQYLLSIYQPDGVIPPPEMLDRVMIELEAVNEEIRAAGAWVFTSPLTPASAATVVRHRDGETLLTDGPYAEGKEHVGGFWLVESPDLDAALGWADRIAQVTTLPIEVRPLAGRAG